jgi:hypothetical protein
MSINYVFIFLNSYNELLAQNGKFKERDKHKRDQLMITWKQTELGIKTNYKRNINVMTAVSDSSVLDGHCVLCYQNLGNGYMVPAKLCLP